MWIFLCSIIFSIIYAQQNFSAVNRWEKVPEGGNRFLARDAHSAVAYQDKLWVIGGHSTEYYTSRSIVTNSRSDVWISEDAKSWIPLLYEAPWDHRYGHTVNVFSPQGQDAVMVLMGGFTPLPANDVWTSNDGIHWNQVELNAPWSGRAWHCAEVFDERLWVMGGTPLSNDVWSTRSLTTGDWTNHGKAPWKARAAHSCVTHQTIELVLNVTTNKTSRVFHKHLYLMGGWDRSAMNDVWRMDKNGEWTMLLEEAPWPPRGWASFVSFQSETKFDIIKGDRLWLFGGGNIGGGVQKMFGYSDSWYTRDGVQWEKASSDASGISTAEWCSVYIQGKLDCIGKWGHSAVVFKKKVPKVFRCNETCRTLAESTSLARQIIALSDATVENPPQPFAGKIKKGDEFKFTTVYPDGCEICRSERNRYYEDKEIPAIYFIGGDVAGLTKSREVYVSDAGMICENNGQICSNLGTCSAGGGCFCVEGKDGQFCTEEGIFVERDSSFSCFTGDSTVQLKNGTTATIDRISIGDKVQSISPTGQVEYSTVYYLPHQYDDHIPQPYLHLVASYYDYTKNTRLHLNLKITPSHLLYIKTKASLRNASVSDNTIHTIPARDVKLGMLIVMPYQHQARWAQITAISYGKTSKLYSFYTLSGRMVINGILCNNYGHFYPQLPHKSIDFLPHSYFYTHRILYQIFPSSITSNLLYNWNYYIFLPTLKLFVNI